MVKSLLAAWRSKKKKIAILPHPVMALRRHESDSASIISRPSGENRQRLTFGMTVVTPSYADAALPPFWSVQLLLCTCWCSVSAHATCNLSPTAHACTRTPPISLDIVIGSNFDKGVKRRSHLCPSVRRRRAEARRDGRSWRLGGLERNRLRWPPAGDGGHVMFPKWANKIQGDVSQPFQVSNVNEVSQKGSSTEGGRHKEDNFNGSTVVKKALKQQSRCYHAHWHQCVQRQHVIMTISG